MGNNVLDVDLDELTDKQKYNLATQVIGCVDNFGAAIVTTDPGVTDPNDVEDVKDIVDDFNENLKKEAIQTADDEHFKYAEELNLFRKKVEDYCNEVDPQKKQNYALKLVVEGDIEETWKELEDKILDDIKYYFSNGHESDKISEWFENQKMRSPEGFRGMSGRQYQWETMARAVEYMEGCASRMVKEVKNEVKEIAEEKYYNRQATPLMEQAGDIGDASKVFSIINANPNLSELADQPGVFWSWFKHIDDPGSAYKAKAKDVTNFVKSRCNAYGPIRPAAWKYLTKLHKEPVFEIIDSGGYGSSIPDISENILFNLSEARVSPDGDLVEKIISHIDLDGYFNWTSHSPTAILRACRKRWEDVGGGRVVWEDDIIPVLDWAENAQPELDHNQQTAPWSWFENESNTWHEEVGNSGFNRYSDYTWNSLIDQKQIEGYFVVSLTSSDDLDEEGEAMSHCVRRYDKKCIRQDSRVFSIREKPDDVDTTLATLEIRRSGSTWKLKQVRGKHNNSVGPFVRRIARKLKNAYAKLWKEAGELERVESLQYNEL